MSSNGNIQKVDSQLYSPEQPYQVIGPGKLADYQFGSPKQQMSPVLGDQALLFLRDKLGAIQAAAAANQPDDSTKNLDSFLDNDLKVFSEKEGPVHCKINS